jgi:hypothetical protein
MVGDAAGAPLEFPRKGTWVHSARWVGRALTMRSVAHMPPPRLIFAGTFTDLLFGGGGGGTDMVPSQGALKDALAMRGGGIHGVAPGQITDDGEMTMALLRALAGFRNGVFKRGLVALGYMNWLYDHNTPFDAG